MERLLIKKVKENNVLYDTRSTCNNTQVRQRAWQKIGEELNIDPEEAKATWFRLRRCFTNARNRRSTKEHECGVKISPWKYDKDMSFLCQFVRHSGIHSHETQNNDGSKLKNNDSDSPVAGADIARTYVERIPDYNSYGASGSYNESEEMPISMVESILGNKRAYSQNNDIPQRLDDKRKCLFQPNAILEMDEIDLFFLSMSKMTKSLPPLERAKVTQAVSNAVLQTLVTVRENLNPS